MNAFLSFEDIHYVSSMKIFQKVNIVQLNHLVLTYTVKFLV